MRLFGRKKLVHSNDFEDEIRIIDEKTPFAVKEAFKTLYTKILYLPIVDKCKKIAITSAYPGEGKTYISTNVSITIAQSSSDKKILLIDLDMRKPRVAKLLKKYFRDTNDEEDYSGLSEFLAGIDKTPTIKSTKIPNFDVMLSGKESANPSGLINSPKFDELLAICEENYDYVIFDCPPINIVTDAMLISNKISGYILATRNDYSNINDLCAAVQTLNDVGAEVFGVVLSSVNPKKSSGSGYSSHYAHSYYK